MEIKTILQDIGLTPNEIKIYLELLKLGTTTTGNIIKKTGVHGSKVYDGLERLATKGLVGYVKIANTKHYKAVEPIRLIDFLKDKKKKIDEQENEINKIIPELSKMMHVGKEESEAEVFQGWKGMETIFNDGIREMGKGDTWYVLGAYAGEDRERTDRFIQKVIMKCEEKKMKWRIIYNESARDTFKYEQKSFITTNRFIDQETPATINIYKDVVFIALWIRDPIVFRVRNKKVAESFREYFEVMWKLAHK
ncbi:MAG: helix-turn-helix domain-containing protein [Candidatus Micrarchaeota archaeon]|nr:helix-turn-helix domain-containing protein [Candidatus Micrarchaeota archaeon]